MHRGTSTWSELNLAVARRDQYLKIQEKISLEDSEFEETSQ